VGNFSFLSIKKGNFDTWYSKKV